MMPLATLNNGYANRKHYMRLWYLSEGSDKPLHRAYMCCSRCKGRAYEEAFALYAIGRVKSGKFGHQVNSDTRLQTVEIQMRRLIRSRLIRIFTVLLS